MLLHKANTIVSKFSKFSKFKTIELILKSWIIFLSQYEHEPLRHALTSYTISLSPRMPFVTAFLALLINMRGLWGNWNKGPQPPIMPRTKTALWTQTRVRIWGHYKPHPNIDSKLCYKLYLLWLVPELHLWHNNMTFCRHMLEQLSSIWKIQIAIWAMIYIHLSPHIIDQFHLETLHTIYKTALYIQNYFMTLEAKYSTLRR